MNTTRGPLLPILLTALALLGATLGLLRQPAADGTAVAQSTSAILEERAA